MEKKEKEYLQGSFTVEAAFLMALVLLVVLSVLYLCFFIQNRGFYTAAACEAVISGSSENTRKMGNAENVVLLKAQAAETVRYPGITQVRSSASVTQKMVQVEFAGKIPWAVWNVEWDVEVEESSKVIKPVSFIRKLRAARAVTKELTDERKGSE